MCELSITDVHPPDPGDEWYLTQDNICSSAPERIVGVAEGVYFQPVLVILQSSLLWCGYTPDRTLGDTKLQAVSHYLVKF